MLVFVIDALRLFGRGHKTNMSNSCGSGSWPSNAAVESCSCPLLACRWRKSVAIHIPTIWIVFIAQRQLTPLRPIVISFGLIVFALYHPQCFFNARLCYFGIPVVFLICVLGVTLNRTRQCSAIFPYFFSGDMVRVFNTDTNFVILLQRGDLFLRHQFLSRLTQQDSHSVLRTT